MKEGLRRLAEPVAPPDAFERVTKKRSRRRVVRRIEGGFLAVVVLGAVVGGAYGLVRAFRPGKPAPNTLGSAAVNGKIAYVVRGEGGDAQVFPGQIYTVNPDGTGKTELVEGRDPAWSPDGTRIAFRTGIPERSGEQTHIVVANADGTGAHSIYTLPVEPGTAGPPAWSPNGTRIAFANIDGIYVVGADGSNPYRISMYEGQLACYDLSPTWSPDGTTIAFAIRCDGGEEGIWAEDVDGSHRRRLLAPSASIEAMAYPQFSPDGTEISFSGEPPPATGNGSIYVMNADGSGVRELVDGAWWTSPPAWSPDGTELAFVRADGGLATVHLDGTGLRRLDVDGISPTWQTRPATPQSTASTSGLPSPDRTRVGLCDISTVHADFDGDGRPDEATLYHKGLTGCPTDPSQPVPFPHTLRVTFGPGRALHRHMTECGEYCRIFTAPDLDGDGRTELAVTVSEGASTFLLDLFTVDPERVALITVPALRPGAGRWLVSGGSVTHEDNERCVDRGGDRLLVVTSAEFHMPDTKTWHVHEAVLRFRTGSLTLVSERNFTTPTGSPQEKQLSGGGPFCGGPEPTYHLRS